MNNVVENSKMSPKKPITAKQQAKYNLTKRKNPDWDNLDRGYRYLTQDMKLPHDQAIAVMGNVVEESQGNYKAKQKNGKGQGLIQWDKAPNSRYGQWGSIWASVAKPANVYDASTDTVKNYWAPWGGLKGDKVRQKFIKAPLKQKTQIYAESYLRPGKPRIADRQLSAMQLDSIYNPRIKNILIQRQGGKINIVEQFKQGGRIRKMQTAAGGPIYLSTEDIKNGANALGSAFLRGLGYVGQGMAKVLSSPNWSGSTATNSYARNKKDVKRQKKESDSREQSVAEGSVWLSPYNYGAALLTGNGLNARKGGEEIEKLEPWQQALLRGTELYVGPKAVKGVKSAPRVIVNTAAKAGVKPAKAAVIAREIKQATKNKPNLSNRTYTENRGQYTLFSPFGEDIGNLLTTKPLTSEMKGKGISMISSKNKGKGVSEDLYNVAVEDSKELGYQGLESGHDLFKPKLTMHVTDKFPKIETSNVSLQKIDGKWQYAPDPNQPPIRLLTGTSGKPLPNFIQELTNHRIDLETLKNQQSIKFNETTGEFEEVPIKEIIQKPSTSLAFFEKEPSKMPQITVENAASITPEQWTAAQNAAIARGDMVEAQRLRDLHFKVSAPNSVTHEVFHHGNTKPMDWYTFDPERVGTTDEGYSGAGYYFAPTRPASQYVKEHLTHTLGPHGEQNAGLSGGRYHRYVYLNGETKYKPLVDHDWTTHTDFPFVDNRPIEVVVGDNRQIKLADAITHDDNGVRISLGKRDNFNLNDIRYGLLPITVGYTLHNLFNQPQQQLQYQKQGGKMNILEFLKKGSGIHIKKENKGKFTSYCGGTVTDECIRRGKNSSSATIRKRATFAANARKWKHKKGGKAFVEGVNVLDSNPDAYKYVKKKYKMRSAANGTKIDWGKVNNTMNTIGSVSGSIMNIAKTFKNQEALEQMKKANESMLSAFSNKALNEAYEEALKDETSNSQLVNKFNAYHKASNKVAQKIAQKKQELDQELAQAEQANAVAQNEAWMGAVKNLGGFAMNALNKNGMTQKATTNTSSNDSMFSKNTNVGGIDYKTFNAPTYKTFNDWADANVHNKIGTVDSNGFMNLQLGKTDMNGMLLKQNPIKTDLFNYKLNF